MKNTIDYDASFLEAVKKGYWKDFNERYLISKYGTVYDKERDKIVKPWISNGYEQINVKDNGKWGTKYVHQLVWEAFNGKVPKGMEVNHISECKTENSLSNLNLLSHKANCNWGTRNERVAKSKSKSVIQKNLDGEVIKVWASTREIQRKLGFNQGNICKCCKGKIKTAFKYLWQYTEEKAAS